MKTGVKPSFKIVMDTFHATAEQVSYDYAAFRPGVPISSKSGVSPVSIDGPKSPAREIYRRRETVKEFQSPITTDDVDELLHQIHNLGIEDYVEVKTDNVTARELSPDKQNLLVLDLNGIFTHRVFDKKKEIQDSTAIRVGNFLVWLRPHTREFFTFIFQNFEVGVWSSVTKANLEPMVKLVFGELYEQLLFVADQSFCDKSPLSDANAVKPIFLKNLKDLWQYYPQFNMHNTLIIDDSDEKMINNPPECHFNPGTWAGSMDDDALKANGHIYAAVKDFAVRSDALLDSHEKLTFEQVKPDEPSESTYSHLREIIEDGYAEGAATEQ